MWWECGECGSRTPGAAAPVVCHECGRASSAFVEVLPEIEGDAEVSSVRDAWIRAGTEGSAFHFFGDVAWDEPTDDAA